MKINHLIPAAVVFVAAGIFVTSAVSASNAVDIGPPRETREPVPISEFLDFTDAQIAWDQKIGPALQLAQNNPEVPPQAPTLLRTEFSEEKNEDGSLKPLVFEPSLVDGLVARYVHCSNLQDIANAPSLNSNMRSDSVQKSMEQLKQAEGIDGFFNTDDYANFISAGAKVEGLTSLDYELKHMCDVLEETRGE